jgi:hypothetical protein
MKSLAIIVCTSTVLVFHHQRTSLGGAGPSMVSQPRIEGTPEKTEVVPNCDHLARLRFSPVLPRAFTEPGATMAANAVLPHLPP